MTVEAPTQSAEQNATQEKHRLWKAIANVLVCAGVATIVGGIALGAAPFGAALIGGGIVVAGEGMKNKTISKIAHGYFRTVKSK
jgi:hypothetical protein